MENSANKSAAGRLPFRRKHFVLDVAKRADEQRLAGAIRELGGKCVPSRYLSPSKTPNTLLVSDHAQVPALLRFAKRQQRNLRSGRTAANESSSFRPFSPANQPASASSTLLTTLLKAVPATVREAYRLNIKIVFGPDRIKSFEDEVKKCRAKRRQQGLLTGAPLKGPASGTGSNQVQVLHEPYLKLEDFEQKFRPDAVRLPAAGWNMVYLLPNATRCLFDRNDAAEARRRTQYVSQKLPVKRLGEQGYCAVCREDYPCLDEHVSCAKHRKLAKRNELFAAVDNEIGAVLDELGEWPNLKKETEQEAGKRSNSYRRRQTDSPCFELDYDGDDVDFRCTSPVFAL